VVDVCAGPLARRRFNPGGVLRLGTSCGAASRLRRASSRERAATSSRTVWIARALAGPWPGPRRSYASGVGKTHLANALGYVACIEGFRVRFALAADLVNDLVAAQARNTLSKRLLAWAKYDVLLIDELGYLSFDSRGADLLYQVFNKRYLRAATVVTKNLAFKEWGQRFHNAAAATAIADRLVHNGLLNYLLASQEKALPSQLRLRGDDVTAVVNGRYAPLDAELFVETMREALRQHGVLDDVRVKALATGPTDAMRLVLRGQGQEVKVGDVSHVGLDVSATVSAMPCPPR
jgi:hypothetical protein